MIPLLCCSSILSSDKAGDEIIERVFRIDLILLISTFQENGPEFILSILPST
ncbi:hypothetical protein GCM10007894_03560 [Paraferrimonas haliotis]|uniref:Uncharacterized protein n=1 Tax=Paraferrimonas haliotis TaxID=2013866 RepID=A0AA37TJG8_9GAMM|nr:hypothetical protein GCM10007894_03560 [Paraferrimonas haliotis]